MRFVLAIISFVLAAVLMGIGIGQRTIFAGPDEVVAKTSQASPAAVTVIDGSALGAHPQGQTVTLSGATKISAAYGRTTDVLGWVGTTTYNHVTFDEKTGKLVSKVVEGDATEVPTLAGSDLWLKEYNAVDSLQFRANLPDDVSVIAVSNGVDAAPADVTIRWPLDNSTPWSGPLLAAGAALLLLGLGLLIWALTHMRNSRGPRRTPPKQPKMPKLPRQPRYKPKKANAKAIAAPKGRRATRRSIAVVPVLLVGALALTGCTTDILPALTGKAAATPTATATETPTTVVLPPAVTEAQIVSIVRDISTVTAKSDSDLDKKLIATRMTGPALELRLANYTVRKANSKLPGATAILPGPIKLSLPQQTDTWPRSVFVVVQDETDTTVAPMALMLVQADARSNYKVEYATPLAADAVIPGVAAANVGAAQLGLDNKFPQMEPGKIAAAYGDILMKDKASTSYASFQAAGDELRTAVGLAAKQATKKALPKTAKITFTNSPGTGDVIALATNNSGALVTVQLNETETVTPVSSGAAISSKGAVASLLGKAKSTKGIVTTYSDQLLFYVPSAEEPSKIVLLGFTQGLISAKEYKKK
ncbi:hypothetical protein [Glaciihabitans sp. dw_435]|uniref:hypothetical protein n=1 Tax=Glaciihabitans sp. dw_435 TaxID=2720081 RepID=UPI001BD35F33|nr:hypothetical protein [Glaciihabitans sp. dw_435]